MVLIALLAWFALILQLCLLLQSGSPLSVPTRVVNFFSFFTILGNLLVALSLTVCLLNPGSKAAGFFFRNVPAITLYILFVGLGYNVLLRHVWNPEGWQKVADELLHLVIPLLYVIYWLACSPKRKLPWKAIWPWMVFPLIYLGYSMVRGALTGLYPYYFIDAVKLGYPVALQYIVALIATFFILALCIAGTERLMAGHKARP